MKPEIDSLLKLGMSAGRVRNMMMFKYLRDPSMLALIPETKKMENRKAHLKKQAGEGFKQSLSGNLGQVELITEAEVTFLSLQQVIVDDQQIDKMNPLILRAKWSCEDAVRNALRCTCKSYMHTGWVCAHSIASLHLLEKLKIGLAMASVPMRGLPGRPRALVGALQRESDMYDVDRLIELFKTNPGRPLKWPVVQEFDVSDENKTFKEHRVGQVAGCRLSETEGVYIWSVTFIHGDSLEYQVEELAHAVRRAYALGTQ
ncbi:DmX protein 1 [Phytophthora nicotianae]|uniref:DmX protein 1 n=1 Tax=Phytophthora nicotianae TaxID=4792 RepID=A0A0W8CXA3_PHYNI|nr:DmX protein 1 [Phytophthora nicotianae]